MSKIPTELTKSQFEKYILPNLSTAKRGFVCKIPLYKVFNYILYKLHTGCQWYKLPIDQNLVYPEKKEISFDAISYHYRKWCRDGSLKKVWKNSIPLIMANKQLSEIQIDGTHTLAKKGGENVGYQFRKKAKTSNILPFVDDEGNIIASSFIITGNHNDAFNLKPHLQAAFKSLKKLGLHIEGAFFNADKAFDSKETRKTCFNHGLIPNIPENKRNRQKPKRGRKRLFNPPVYKKRFTIERTFAWIDKFRHLQTRFERKSVYWFGAHCIVFSLINLRHLFAT